MSRRAAALLSWFVLGVVAIGVIPSTLRPWELPYERDLLDFFVPMKAIYARTVLAGDIPWWEPWTLGGEPFFASLQSQVFYPPNLLFLAVPLPWSLSLSSSLHVAIAAAGALLLARELGRGWPGSLLAATTFATGGFVVSLVNLHNQLCSIAWLPWAWLAAIAFARRGRRRALAGWATALSLALLAGEPQFALLAGLSSAALGWCVGRGAGRAVRNAVLAAALVAAACAVQALPFLELARRSDRVEPGWAQAGRHGLAAEDLRSLVVAPSPARPAPAGPYVKSIFVGPTCLLLALAGLGLATIATIRARSRTAGDKTTLLLGALAGASAVLAMGSATPFGRALVEATPFLRFPVKYFAIAALAIPLLASTGLECVEAAALARRARPRFVAFAAWLAVLVTAGHLVAVHRSLVPSLPFDALMQQTSLHRLLVAQTAPDGPRVHAPPLTRERLTLRARRLASGDVAGAMRERVELLEGGLPAYFGIHSTWGGVALTPLPQAHLLARAEGPLDPTLETELKAGFVLDSSARTLPLPALPVDGGAARLYVLEGAGGGAPWLRREWLGSSECVGPAGAPAPSSYPGWREIEPGHWRFRPRGLAPLAVASILAWLAILGLAVIPERSPAVASEAPRL